MGFLDQPLEFYIFGNPRSINNISGYITINENTVDSLEITQQPVQQGAMIADHAFLKPVTFSAQLQFAPSLFNTLKAQYQELLDLQASREPFTIVTPKRIYKNMLFQSLSVTTDKRTENVLAVNATFEQIIIVNVNVLTLDPSKLANAASNQATQNVGKKSFLKQTSGAFSSLFSG